jgi:hypothetical protein
VVFEQLPFETIDEKLPKQCKFIENTLKLDYNDRNFNIVEKGNNFCQ